MKQLKNAVHTSETDHSAENQTVRTLHPIIQHNFLNLMDSCTTFGLQISHMWNVAKKHEKDEVLAAELMSISDNLANIIFTQLNQIKETLVKYDGSNLLGRKSEQ